MPSLGLGPQVSGQEERSPEPQDHGRQWPGSWPPGPPLRLPWPHVSQGGSAAPPGRQEWMGACEGRWRVSSPRGVTGGAGAGERAAGSLLRLVLEGRLACRPRGTEGGEPWQPQVPPHPYLSSPPPLVTLRPGLAESSTSPHFPKRLWCEYQWAKRWGRGPSFPSMGSGSGPVSSGLDSKAPAPSPLPSPRPSLLPTPLSLHFYFKLSWLFMPIASGWVWLPLAPMPMVPPPRPGQSPALLGPGSGVRCVCAGGERAPSGEEPQECA